MRPPRPDIAAPPLPPGLRWTGGRAPVMERLVASSPVLVHFFDFAQLNSIRALPYVLAWRRRYREAGLVVLGIHTARFPFTRDPEAVAAACERLGIEHPVAADTERSVWRDYGPRGWPSLFLWGAGGALRWHHLGEGEYAATEEAIREAIEAAREARADEGAGGEAGEARTGWPPLMAPLRPEDEPGAVVIPPTPEIFPGGSPERPAPPEEAIEADYEAGGAHAAVDVSGGGELRVALDGEAARPIRVSDPGLYALAEHPRHERHRLRLEAPEGVAVYAVSFAPGLPA